MGYFFKGQVYDWGCLKILARTPIPKLPTSYFPHAHIPPPKNDYTFLKIFLKSKVFNYRKNQGFLFKEKGKHLVNKKKDIREQLGIKRR